MKNKLLLLLITLLSASGVARAQITFEHRLPNDTYPFNTSQDGTWYAEVNSHDSVISVYRADFSLYKDMHLPNKNLGGSLDMHFLSDKLFNLDNKLEYLLVRTSGPYTNEALLVNEDGEILYEFGDISNSYPFLTQRTGMSPVLGIRKVDFNLLISVTDLYSLPGTYLSLQHPGGENVIYPSPNPTDSYIRIPYDISNSADALLTIYNTSGAQVEKRILDKNEKSLILNVSGLPSGGYIYKYGNTTGKFIVK